MGKPAPERIWIGRGRVGGLWNHVAGRAPETDDLRDQWQEYVRADLRALSAEQPAKEADVDFYEREFYPLSNFSAFKVEWHGYVFDTSEAAYHWSRFDKHARAAGHRHAIMFAKSAHEAFRYAQDHKKDQRPDWDSIKVTVMREIITAKAEQHEYCRRKLRETRDRLLVEGSWRDSYWGIGPDGKGQNMLGKLWMEVRAELRTIPSADPCPSEQVNDRRCFGYPTYGNCNFPLCQCPSERRESQRRVDNRTDTLGHEDDRKLADRRKPTERSTECASCPIGDCSDCPRKSPRWYPEPTERAAQQGNQAVPTASEFSSLSSGSLPNTSGPAVAARPQDEDRAGWEARTQRAIHEAAKFHPREAPYGERAAAPQEAAPKDVLGDIAKLIRALSSAPRRRAR